MTLRPLVKTKVSLQQLHPLCQMLLTLQQFPLVFIVRLSYLTHIHNNAKASLHYALPRITLGPALKSLPHFSTERRGQSMSCVNLIFVLLSGKRVEPPQRSEPWRCKS